MPQPFSLKFCKSDLVDDTKCNAFTRSWEHLYKARERTSIIPIISSIINKINTNSNKVKYSNEVSASARREFETSSSTVPF
jgi:hypothetical protein